MSAENICKSVDFSKQTQMERIKPVVTEEDLSNIATFRN